MFLRSRNSLVMSDLHDFVIFRVKIGVQAGNFDFWFKFRPKMFFFDLAETLTKKAFEDKKMTRQVQSFPFGAKMRGWEGLPIRKYFRKSPIFFRKILNKIF